jgi:ABC-type multidrug transport system permease subunit
MKEYSLVLPFGCTDVLFTIGAVLSSITIPVVLMFCPLMEQYILVLPFLSCISGQNISTTGMVILVSTAPLVDRTSVQQEW